jgi:methionyl-tRNA synthetase
MNARVQAFLNVESLNFTDRDTVLAGHAINKFKPLLTRIEMTQIDTLIEASKEDAAADAEKGKPKPVSTEAKPAGKDAKPAKEKPAKAATAETEQGAEIEFSDFAKLDLRVAKVVEAEAQVPLALAEAFRSGNLGVMDYYRLNNIKADTDMRDSISKGDEKA